jgi:hypothetical protein
MIRFNCHCTHEFLVPDDQAGGMIQCPKCSRLNDVPTISDLENLEQGGIFKISEATPAPGKDVLPSATRAFTRDHHDHRGDDIDMRPSVDEFLNAGVEEVPLELAEEIRPGAPKYDPLTGELVEAIDVAPRKVEGTDIKSIPVAKRAVQYASGDLHLRVTPGTIMLHLLQPVNMFVMLFVVLAHTFFQATLSIVLAGIFFAAPVLILIGALLIAHYGVLIEEIGTGESEELPRPLRNASFFEDIWNPFIRFNFAILLCFWPAIFFRDVTGPAGTGLLITCFFFGIYFFPAVLMTTLLAGSYLNVRPDRVIGTVRALGPAYWVSVFAFVISGSIYLAGIGICNFAVTGFFAKQAVSIPVIGFAIGSPTLLLGVFLFHFACWNLALLYRGNQEKLPWVLQRHVHSRRTDTLAQLEAARKAAQRHDALRANQPDRDQRLAEIRAAEKARQAQTAEKPIWDRVAETRNE